ncbi:MAG: hypothetical protein K0V04_43255 [Deltaproteobacteria bacterium]|nr:hypothetical protein [Deltaproteobacteria bacterium]
MECSRSGCRLGAAEVDILASHERLAIATEHGFLPEDFDARMDAIHLNLAEQQIDNDNMEAIQASVFDERGFAQDNLKFPTASSLASRVHAIARRGGAITALFTSPLSFSCCNAIAATQGVSRFRGHGATVAPARVPAARADAWAPAVDSTEGRAASARALEFVAGVDRGAQSESETNSAFAQLGCHALFAVRP